MSDITPQTEIQQAKATSTVKIPFDSLTLRGVVAELRALLVGGQIQDIRQPSATDITLSIRSQNRTLVLLLSCDAQFARAHLTTRKRPNPVPPPNFCMALRKYLENLRIRDVRQAGFDRILQIDVGGLPIGDAAENEDEEDAPAYTLTAELMGKHSNIILVNGEGVILDAAKRVSKRINRVREILPGLTYAPPPTQTDRVDPFASDAVPFLVKEIGANLNISPKDFAEILLALYAGISPFLAREMAARFAAARERQGTGGSTSDSASNPAQDVLTIQRTLRAALEQVWQETFNTHNVKAQVGAFVARDAQGQTAGAYPLRLLQIRDLRQEPVASLNNALDDTFGHQIEHARASAVEGELRGLVGQEIKRTERQRQSVARTLAEAERSEQYKQTGELLLANLWRIQPHTKEVTLQDYYDPAFPDRTIELDAKLTPQENADSYFRRYRKARDAEERALEESVRLDDRAEELRVAQNALNHAQTEEELRALRTDLQTRGILRPPPASERERSGAEPEFAGHKIRRYTTPQGYEILVGENATSNDYLTLRVASPNDWWLHVRAAASSHVVVRSHGKPYEVPHSVLERAAELCARHSQQKHSSLVSVDYTLKKHVRKPRGSAPGAADYQHEQTLDVTS